MGPEMMNQFRAQAERFGTRFVTDDVDRVELSDGGLQRVFLGQEEHRAKAVILAMGAEPRRLGIPGELELSGCGVSTCGVCDGAFFKGKKGIVIGGGDSAMEDAIFVSKYASELTIVNRRDEFRASKIMQERALSNKKIEPVWNHQIEEGIGDDKQGVTGVRLKSVLDGAVHQREASGMFLAIGHTPNTGLFRGQIELDEAGYIVTHHGSKTSIPGVFAAGDVQDHVYRQAVTAAGSGCMAALDAERFLSAEEGHEGTVLTASRAEAAEV